MIPQSSYLSDDDWHDLLMDIHNQQVIPIIGPELVTVPDPETKVPPPLLLRSRASARESAEITLSSTAPSSLNRVACEYLRSSGARKSIYREVSELLNRLSAAPPAALCDLASITDFDLCISSTIDSPLAAALEKCRPGFQRA